MNTSTIVVNDYQRIKNQQLVLEPKLQHICAQAHHIYSGLQSIRNFIQEHSLSTTVSEADEAVIIKVIDDITYLANYIYEEMIPYLQQKLGRIIYHSNIYSSCDQNEPIDMDIDQICHLRRIGLTWVAISTLMGISRTTLYRRRKEVEISNLPIYLMMISSKKLLKYVYHCLIVENVWLWVL